MKKGRIGRSAASVVMAVALFMNGLAPGFPLVSTVLAEGDTVTIEPGTDEARTGTGDMTISLRIRNKINPSVSLEGWEEGGTPNTPVVTNYDGDGSITYTYAVNKGDTYTDTVPTTPGTHSVKATIAQTDTYEGGECTADFVISPKPKTGQMVITLSIHKHNFTYAASGATITATCGESAGTCDLSDHKVSLTLHAPAKTKDIDSNSAEATLDATELAAFNEATGLSVSAANITYVGRGDTTYTESATAPTAAGTYTAKLTVDGLADPATMDYTIASSTQTRGMTITLVIKEKASVTTAPAANTLSYTGEAQGLVTAGQTAEGMIQYALGEDAQEAPETGWSENLPTAINAGTYYVYYKVIGDNDHRDSDVFNPVTVTIAPAAITITPDDKSSKYRTPIQKLTYQIGGAYHEGDELNVTLETTATATSTVGEYPITVKSWENANYTATLGSGTYTVTRTDLTVTAFGYDGTYDGEDHGITVDVGDSDAVVYYSTDKELTKDNYKQDGSTTNPVRRDAGKMTVYYYVETANFDPQPVSSSKDINIAKATNTAVPKRLTATKASSGISDAVINGVNDTMECSTDGGQTWTKVAAGSMTVTGLSAGEVQVRYAESKNYKAGAAVTVTILEKDDQAAPDSTAFTVTRTSTSIAKDGSISGVNDCLEYSVDGGQIWTKVPAGSTVITGLGAGNVLIRYAGNADYNPSPAVSVKVGFGSGELVVYFAPDSDSEYDQIVTYNDELNQYEYVYTGSGIMPAIIVEGLDGRLTEGLDYTVSYSNNINVDKKGKPAQVTVTGKGNFTKKKTLEFYILPKQLDDGNGNAADDINVAKVVVAQGGTAVPVVSYNGNVLKKTDYTVTSSTGSLKFKTAVEDATLTITAKAGGNYTGTIKDIPVTVLTKAEAKKLAIKVTLAKSVSRTYTGKPHTLNITGNEGSIDGEDAGGFAGELTVTDASGTKTLAEGTDFVVSYSANVNVGTVKVTVTGTGDYTGSVTKTFKILPDKKDAVIKTYFADGMVSTEDTANAPKFVYRKGGVKPQIVVTAERGDEVLTLSEGTDYKISYSGNNKVGTKAKFTVTFLGNYKGRAAIKNQTFEITKATLADADITIGDKAYTVYSDDDGRKYANKSVPYVSIDGVQLTQNTDYTVTYWYNGLKINANKIKLAANEESRVITVKITGKGNYEAETFEDNYTVKKVPAQSVVNLSKAKIYAKGTKKAVPDQGYIGEPLEPEIDVYVKIGKTWTKVDESLYTVTYVNNIERGKAKILVNGDGEGAVGSRQGTFKIVRWKLSMLNQLVD